MEWVEGFYSRTGRWWGEAESVISRRDTDRLHLLTRHTEQHPLRILDLGSSYGTTPLVLAEAGHDVTGVEISERITYAQHLASPTAGSLEFVHGDFYAFTNDERFDVVTYWNGFGIGSDTDQRRLLRRIADHWLHPDGIALIDVFNPIRCSMWAGDEEIRDARPDAGYPYSVRERTDFDPVGNRFIDTWWEADRPDDPISQSLRCYTPADLLLLLEGTGMRLRAIDVGGKSYSIASGELESASNQFWKHHEYLAVLVSAPH